MNTPDIEQLNTEFAFQHGLDSLQFRLGARNIPVLEVTNEQASAVISMQGAQVLSWKPVDEEEVIWVSTDATFAHGKSVRGGIPICWPWFGAHKSNASFPAHGFARTVLWQVAETRELLTGETKITFRLDPARLDKNIRDMWPLATVAEYTLTIGKTLGIELTTNNHSDQTIVIGEALHTYFNVQDLTRTTVHGLEGKEYLDKTDGFARKIQTGPISIMTEVDRVYVDTPDDVIINNKKREIIIKKQGSQSTVVWNPWQVVAEKMGDLGMGGYLQMLCVESANAAENVVSIRPGGSHTLSVMYTIEAV